jgi:hypothetical protein
MKSPGQLGLWPGLKSWCWGTTLRDSHILPTNCGSRMNGADRPVLSYGRRNRQRAALLEQKEPDDLVADKAVPSDGQSNRHGHTT